MGEKTRSIWNQYKTVLLKDGKEIDSEKVYMGGEYMFVEIQNKCIFPRLSKKFCDFNKLSLYLTMYTMEEGKIWIEDDMKEILKIIKEGKYYIGTENREEEIYCGMKRIIYLLLLVVVVLAGCKSSKHLAT